eukprot:205178_1
MARLLAFTALVVLGCVDARITERLQSQASLLAVNTKSQDNPWLIPGSYECERRCSAYLNSFKSYCWTRDIENITDFGVGDYHQSLRLLQTYLLNQPNYNTAPFCSDICHIDLKYAPKVESVYGKHVKNFVVELDHMNNDTLLVHSYSQHGQQLCCSAIVDGALAPPTCQIVHDGHWELNVAPRGDHDVTCERYTTDGPWNGALLLPPMKKIVCYADCLVIPIPPVCDVHVKRFEW